MEVVENGSMRLPRVAIAMSCHNRLDCTRINQEIIKLNYERQYQIALACSGDGAEQYLADVFVQVEPKPHLEGALNLIQTAVRATRAFEPDIIVVLDGDTWLLDETMLTKYIDTVFVNQSLLMAATHWNWGPARVSLLREIKQIWRLGDDRVKRLFSIPQRLRYDAADFSTQFFVLRNDPRLIDALVTMPFGAPWLEGQWFDRYASRFPLKAVVRMKEREPLHPRYRWLCEPLGLYTQHWPAAGSVRDPRSPEHPEYVGPDFPGKREALVAHPAVRKGDHLQRLLNADDFDYYNAGASRSPVWYRDSRVSRG